MDELRLNDEQLTTRDIAYPARTGTSSRAGVIDPSSHLEEQQVERRAEIENLPAETAGREILESDGPLFPDEEMQAFRRRWDGVQTSFVDEPRQAKRADRGAQRLDDVLALPAAQPDAFGDRVRWC